MATPPTWMQFSQTSDKDDDPIAASPTHRRSPPNLSDIPLHPVPKKFAARKNRQPAHPAETPPSDGSSPFMRLPLELRQMIYVEHSHTLSKWPQSREHRISGYELCCKWRWGEPLSLCDQHLEGLPPAAIPFFLPTMGLVSEQIREELIPYMLKHTPKIVLNFKPSRAVRISAYFAKFLESTSRAHHWDAFDTVREFDFPYFGQLEHVRRPKNPDVDLIVCCPKLKKVTLKFPSSALLKITFENGQSFHHSVKGEETVAHYGLRPILGCKELEEIRLKWDYFPRYPLGHDYFVRFYSLGCLAVWLRDNFEEQGQKVKVFLPCITGHDWIGQGNRRYLLSGGLPLYPEGFAMSERSLPLEDPEH